MWIYIAHCHKVSNAPVPVDSLVTKYNDTDNNLGLRHLTLLIALFAKDLYENIQLNAISIKTFKCICIPVLLYFPFTVGSDMNYWYKQQLIDTAF